MSAVFICDACGQTIDDGDRCSINISPASGLRLGMTDGMKRLLDASRGERKRLMAEVEAETKASTERLVTAAKYQTYDLHSACFDAHLAPAFTALRELGDS